jgi:ATP-dependent exoDNAse (exonuclease V) beta subunit
MEEIVMMEHITFISAGAGSGKTYRLASDLEKILTETKTAKPSGIIGTTFTKLAAGELRERVRLRLNERGFSQIANQMSQALLGTVNGVCGQLLTRFAFEAGLSPHLKVIEESEANHLFSLAIEQALSVQTVQDMNTLAFRLGQEDWKAVIKAIVNTARANNQTVEQIKASGVTSADSLLAFFPKPTVKDLDIELHKAVDAAINFIKEGEDQTKGTLNYLALLQDLASHIKFKNLAWSNWVKLSKEETTKKSLVASDAVRHVAADFEKHPRLHADIRFYCEQIFNIAALSLEQFQAYKRNRGLIDFTDQEHLLYDALENPVVESVLRDELDLLMVDEFQDTSPMQLALFLRLAKLAKQVIWVGDVKQAIYGFRGSDPELMQAILKHLKNNGGKTEVLEISWRSRPELVNYVNELFVPAFANTLSPDLVFLNPKINAVELDQSAVEHWQLTGNNKKNRALALAKGLQDFIDSNYQLKDKHTDQLRTAHYGDVAVLCRTNTHLDDIATALSAFKIPISRNQNGLLSTPEAALVLAAMRYLVDAFDSLATAELICLTQGNTPEAWLQSRLDYIATEEKLGAWGDDVPLLNELALQRKRVQYLTPAEVMSQAIHSADIRCIVLSWQADADQAKQRLLNIEQLLDFAVSYENLCGNEGKVASVTGLILWLNQLAVEESDLQTANTQVKAVQLLTHHGAKGLEWPIVMALDLEAAITSNLWGLSVKADNTQLDITDPLKGRTLQYWLWPFGKQTNGIAVRELIDQSEQGQFENYRAQEEAKRLLYVSLTRPRDCLIIPLQDRKGDWFNSLNADWMLPNAVEEKELLLPVSDIKIPVAYKSFEQESSPEISVIQTQLPHWFETIRPSAVKLRAKLSPSAEPMLDNASISKTIILGERINLHGTPDMARLGAAIHALIATNLINGVSEPNFLAEKVLSSYGVIEHISIDDALVCVTRFKNFIEQELMALLTLVEYPIEYQLPNGQTASGWIDALVETEQGYIIIDHKSNPQSSATQQEVALKYTGQLALYKAAVEATTHKPVVGCWIHFAVTGEAVCIDLQAKS